MVGPPLAPSMGQDLLVQVLVPIAPATSGDEAVVPACGRLALVPHGWRRACWVPGDRLRGSANSILARCQIFLLL
ncbi:MAG: hypothetical protein BRC41_06370 [Cyanobacteria bacterium QH_9_48_43]|nr:MAG: hypothetical protein BRC41_06370 [Cyanobacteria bacterium QH_9_48_43]